MAADILHVLGSLKLTVALFACALVLVFAGTLAQHHLNMLEVKQRYFTSWVAMLHFEDLVPYAFLPHDEPIPGRFPIAGGALVGALLMINLIAAKLTRFHLQAKGTRLYAGITVVLLGMLTTYFIITSGQSSEGLQGQPPITYDQLWRIILGFIAAAWVGIVGLAVSCQHRTMKAVYVAAAAIIGVYVIFCATTGYRVDDPGLRIVWQLAKGMGAGVVLLIGCLLLFGNRGGNVLLHFGVGLLMVGQFVFGDRQLEQRLNLIEGKSANTFVNLDSIELVFISKDGVDQQVVAIPSQMLKDALDTSAVIRDPQVPFDVRVKEYFSNSKLETATADTNSADKGIGVQVAAVRVAGSGGTESQVNLASAYIELLEKGTDKSLGSHLTSQWFSDREALVPDSSSGDEFDKVSDGKNEYQMGLRFARTAKPFWVQLSDVKRVNYTGSETPRDYRSMVRILDPTTGEDRREQIWMNNPLRYRGETYYQSNYTALRDGREMTGLQIVQNSGWLIPYVACSITGLGMCMHFAGTLGTFVKRRKRETHREAEQLAKKTGAQTSLGATSESERLSMTTWLAVGGVATLTLMSLVPWPSVMNSLRPANRDTKLDMQEFGKIPVQFGGRIMPLAAFANQTLKSISNKESLPLEVAPGAIRERADAKRLSSLKWLLEVAIDDDRLSDLPMFRIDAEEVRNEFGFEKRESKLFTLNEIRSQIDRFNDLTKAAADKEPRDQSFKEKKLLPR